MLPNQPMILLSFINTKLRDDYDSLDALCDDFRVARDEIEEKIANTDLAKLGELLKDLREILEDTIDIGI